MDANHPLRTWRRAKDLTLEQFGGLIGAAKSTVAAYELRLRFPGAAVLAEIERVTGGQVTASMMVDAYQITPPAPPPRRDGRQLDLEDLLRG